jgi:acetylornithine deacetylase
MKMSGTFFTDNVRQKTRTLLLDLIRIPSMRGNEGPACRYLAERIAQFVDECRLVEIPDSIQDDPDYAFRLPNFSYNNTPQVECVIRGTGKGPCLLFNAHLDVVPPSEGQTDAFQPREENGVVYGRGAVDDKGQVAALFTLAMTLREKGIRPPGDLIFHFVVEEENGGNGTLAMVRRGVKADAAIVLEATEFHVVPAVRGAVWFELETYGRAGHSGNTAGRVSALDKAFEAIRLFTEYHDRLLAASRHLPLFDAYQDPMPLTIGQCEAGNWPASVPAKAILKGLIGFLPNKDRFEVQKGLRATLENAPDEWLRKNFKLSFPMLNSDGNMLPVDHPLVEKLLSALESNGLPRRVRAMTAACDAWFYNNLAGIPTVVFGGGSLGCAHAKDEHIQLEDVFQTAAVLFNIVMDPPIKI